MISRGFLEPLKCANPAFKDGICKIHHPEEIAKKKAKKALQQYGHEQGVLAIDNAILLLVKNGYRVERS